MKKIQAYGKIESGKLSIVKQKDFLKAIAAFKDCRVWVTIEKIYKKRSVSQNAYLWGVVYKLVLEALNESGFDELDKESVHDLCKYKFLKREFVNEKTGEVITSIGETKILKTVEFMEYLENIRQWASEYLNIYIPEPNEQMQLFEL